MKNGDRPINVALKLLDYEMEEVNGEDLVGLTKREYFAAMAMQGILAGGAYYMEQSEQNGIAEDSTRLADALLAELDKTKSE